MAASSSKGNPASHRMNNPKLKEKRARSWAAGEKRKKENSKQNSLQNKENIHYLKNSEADIRDLGINVMDSRGNRQRPSKIVRTLNRALDRKLAESMAQEAAGGIDTI